MASKRVVCVIMALVCLLAMSSCSGTGSTDKVADKLAFIAIDGEKIDDFNPDTQKYNVIIPAQTLVKPKITAENNNGESKNIKYRYPDSIEGVYMVKYNGTIYEINLKLDKQPTDLRNTYYRLTKDNKLNVSYFGGSVTNGYGSSSDDKTWVSLVNNYLKNKFPKATINSLKAAIGGTGSEFGAYRAVKDLQLETRPSDLVFIEFAVNDAIDSTSAADSKEYMENIVRTIYSYSPNADIVFVFITGVGSKGEDFEQLVAQRELAKEYSIPCINVGKALCAELDEYLDMDFVNAKHPEWLKYFIDTVHPNDAGYAKYASYITDYFERVFYNGRNAEQPKLSYCPKKPIYTDLINPEMFNAKGKSGIGDFAVTKDGYLNTDKNGAELTVTFTGVSLKLWCYAGPMSSDIEYTVDNGEEKTVSMAKGSDNHKIYKLADDLDDKKHIVKMKFKKAKGSKVDIRYFLISGATSGKGFSITQ